jgi:hypothetical protein
VGSSANAETRLQAVIHDQPGAHFHGHAGVRNGFAADLLDLLGETLRG